MLRRSELAVDSKSDASPVTVADREAEEQMRQLASERFPSHEIFGEEGGMQAGKGNEGGPSYLWVLDPIDGTKSFITGLLHHLLCFCMVSQW